MKPYLRDEMIEHGYVPQIHYAYKDPGRFDVCRCCPLKLAVMAMRLRK